MADTKRKERAKKPSVASHPLFPTVVVLWFGALFGLASLVIRPVLIEGLVSATGIDQVIPMAAPPLGSTTRILLALMMTLLGCAIGAVVARRLAKPLAKPASTRRRRPAAAAMPADETPSPVALFGAERVEEVEEDQSARRRRQLAVMDADETIDDQAPLPASNQILSVAELPLKSFDEVDEIWLHSSDRAKPRSEETADLRQEMEVADKAEWHEADAPDATSILSHDDEKDVDIHINGSGNRLFDSYVRRVNASVGSNDPSVPAPGFVLMGDLDALSTSDPQEQDAADPTDRPTPQSPDAAEFAAQAAYANTAERIANAPLDTLSHLELLERLAQTIARRRAAAAQTSQDSSVAAPAAEPVWFSSPQAVAAGGELPAALRPHWLDEANDGAEALPAIAPPRNMTMKSITLVQETDGGSTVQEEATEPSVLTSEDGQEPDKDCASMIGVTRMDGRQMFGRNDAPGASAAPRDPAPISASAPRAFDGPNSGEPLPDQTEQALRAALATLRRMSGAA